MRWLSLGLVLVTACSSGRDATAGGDDGGDVTDPDGGLDGRVDSDAAAPTDGGCVVRCGPARQCCSASEECVVDRCMPVCDGTRCGDDDAMCCGGEQLCVGGACVMPGDECMDESDCGDGETCEPLVGRCVPLPDDAECRYTPPSGVFEPEVQWHYDDENSLTIPLVTQLTDDNDDGVINGADVPDVVALTYPSSQFQARITALSGDDGRVLWRTDATPVCGGAPPAVGDLDGDGTVEIVVVLSASGSCGSGSANSQRVAAFSHTGEREWTSSEGVNTRYGAVALADLDADGDVEVVAGGAVFDSDGTFLWRNAELNDVLGSLGANAPSIADVDGDGMLEIAASDRVFNHDGTVLWSGGSVADGFTAIADIARDRDGPHLVAVNATQMQILDAATGDSLLGPVTYETSGILAGPPTVADFDADGRPEIGVAGEHRYVMFDPDRESEPYIEWSVDSMDSSTGSVGSTVFDFDADGSAEVVYADECHLRILDGADGTVLWHTSNTSVTTFEYPVVADVDGDGNAELIVVSNDSSISCGSRALPFDEATRGVRVFRDTLDNWVPTRSVWNQHTYHIDNVRPDGTIPSAPTASWESHNTYRLNRLLDPAAVTLAPNLVIDATGADVADCPARATLRAHVKNTGARGVPAGVEVAFFAGEPAAPGELLGVGETTRNLLAGGSEWVELEAVDAPFDDEGALRFFAVADDDGSGSGAHSECKEDDNAGSPITAECSGPI